MRLRIIASIGLMSGALAIGVAMTPAANGAPAPVPALQPSPRPTLVPTTTPRPTARPTRKEKVVQYGRVTGTVIDQTTSAPAAGLAVVIGDKTVLTDASGNYDTWVPVGSYSVSLALTSAQGSTAQQSVVIDIAANATVVQHLYYTSPAPAAQPVGAPDVPTAMPSAVPTASPESTVVAASDMPEKLPVTGSDDTPLALWLWLALLLVVGGSILNVRTIRYALLGRAPTTRVVSNNENVTLLMTLLIARPRHAHNKQQPRIAQDATLLETLLHSEE